MKIVSGKRKHVLYAPNNFSASLDFSFPRFRYVNFKVTATILEH